MVNKERAMSYITLADLGQTAPTHDRRPADNDTKRAFTKNAIAINAQSQAVPVQALPAIEAQARGVMAALNTFQAWSEPSTAELALRPALYWLWYGKWDSSQTVRANLQAALNNVLVRGGQRGGTVIGQQRDVNVWAETARETPAAVEERAREMAAQGRDAVECVSNPLMCYWEKTTPGQKIAIAGGAALLIGVPALFYFGGFISAAGNIAERLTRNGDFLGYCRTLTDPQLENVLEKEWEGSKRDPDRKSDYEDAEREAERRGWSVSRGRRLS